MIASQLTKNQKKTFRADVMENGEPVVIVATVRFDDQCGNGHNTFSITGERYERHIQRGEPTVQHQSGKTLWLNGCGCIHDDIAKHFPALAPLLKWHLTSTDGPTHYAGNVVYFAGDRDCWGLRKGEFRQHTSRGPHQAGGVEGVPHWELQKAPETSVYAAEKPAPVVLEWVPSGRTGEGKERELDKARAAAVWPDATDAELMQEPAELRKTLKARLPALLEAFRADVESLGFVW